MRNAEPKIGVAYEGHDVNGTAWRVEEYESDIGVSYLVNGKPESAQRAAEVLNSFRGDVTTSWPVD